MSKHKYVNDLNPFGFHEVEVELGQIRRHPSNPRKISKRDQVELDTSITKFGLIDKPIVNLDFCLIAGHQRLDLLESKKITKVTVMMPEIALDDDQVLELLLRHNKNQGEWDFDNLATFDVAKLQEFGWSNEELDKILQQDKEEADLEAVTPEFPLTPRMSEKHSYVLVMVTNEIEKASLETILKLKIVQDYKNSKVGVGRVLTFENFKAAIDSYAEERNRKPENTA